jgi:hypothetical protein
MAHASSAYKQALKEVLSAPGIANRIKNTKAAREVAALQVGHRYQDDFEIYFCTSDLIGALEDPNKLREKMHHIPLKAYV